MIGKKNKHFLWTHTTELLADSDRVPVGIARNGIGSWLSFADIPSASSSSIAASEYIQGIHRLFSKTPPWCNGNVTRLVNQGSQVRSRASPVRRMGL